MKVKFVQDAFIDNKVAFEKDTTHDLSEASAMRWVRRGAATIEEPSAIGKAASKVTGSIKGAAQNLVGKLDDAVNKEHEYENSDGLAAESKPEEGHHRPGAVDTSVPQQNVANTSPESENKATKGNKKQGL